MGEKRKAEESLEQRSKEKKQKVRLSIFGIIEYPAA
jgi:hypothetical protein